MANATTTSHDLQGEYVSLSQRAPSYPCLDPSTIAPPPSTLTMTLPDLPLCNSDQMACGYRNSSDRMVIVRCIGPDEFFLERVVFPFELLSFECPQGTDVQIWTHGLGGAELLETIQADALLIEANPSTPMPLPLEELNPWAKAS
ncbi:MAG: DUF1830 domain-containing protein [Synechococcaceae cyanobacterium]|jgi:hypothetical protein